MGPLERLARRFLRMRVLSTGLLFLLTFWLASMDAGFRPSNPYLALTVVLGALLATFTLLLFIYRVSTAKPPASLAFLAERPGLIILLILVHLIVLNLAGSLLGVLQIEWGTQSFLRAFLGRLGYRSGQLLMWLFIVGAIWLVALMLLRALDRMFLGRESTRRFLRPAYRLTLALVWVYLLYALVLVYNGTLSYQVTNHWTEIVRVIRIPGTSIAWVDLRSWDNPEGIKRVLLAPDRGKLTLDRVVPGMKVMAQVFPGLFHIEWTRLIRGDDTEQVRRFLDTEPSAAYTRKWYIARLLEERRWTEVRTQAEIYLDYYPGDVAYALEIAAALSEVNLAQDSAAIRARTGGAHPPAAPPWLPAAPVPPNRVARIPPPPAPIAAPTPSEQSKGTSREVLKLSGLDRQLDMVVAQADGYLEDYARRAPRPADLRLRAGRPFQRSPLVATAVTVSARALDDKRTPALLAWLNSPLPRRVLRLELDSLARSSEGSARVPDFSLSPPPFDRVALLHRLDNAARITRLGGEMDRAIREAVHDVVSPLLSASERNRAADRRDQERRYPESNEQYRFEMVTWMLRTYQNVPDADLERYVEFYESPLGAWFVGIYRASVLEAIREAGRQGPELRSR